MSRRRSVLVIVTLLAVASPLLAVHPLHTATLTLTYQPAARVLRGSLRVFADDFGATAGRDSASIARYLTPRIGVRDAAGTARPVRFGAPTRDADVIVVPVQVEGVTSPRGLRAGLRVMHERFADQVNVMRVTWAQGDATLLFLTGDGMKAIP